MDLSIIIPAKKEAASIERCLKRVFSSCPGAEVIVVDSGLDDTQTIVQRLQGEAPHLHYLLSSPDRGKGDAIRNGIRKSSRRFIAQLDADLQFLPEELLQLIQPLQENLADMTLGSRFMMNSVREDGSVPGARSLGNVVISFWMSLLVGQRVTDALAGMKAWKREVTESFELTSYTYSYEVELFVRALRKGWRVLDVPITTAPRRDGESTVPVIKTGFTILKDSINFRFFS